MTSRRGVMALRGGADDFVAKPWDTDEMLERVAGVLRRCCRSPLMIDESLTVGELVLEYGSVRVGGVRLDLTKTEHLLLTSVAHQRGTGRSSSGWVRRDAYLKRKDYGQSGSN